MPELDAPGYEYLMTIDVNDLCNDVYGDDNQVTEWLEDHGAPTGGPGVLCAGVAIVGGAASWIGGPVTVVGGASIAGTICLAGTATCTIEGIFSEMTTCNAVELEVYGREEYTTNSDLNVLIVPTCEGYLDVDFDDAVDALQDAGGSAVDTADDIADDLADAGGDVIDEGTDLIGF